MPYFALGLVLLIVLIMLGRGFVAADVKFLARMMRKTGGMLALAAAAFLLVTGRAGAAIPLFVLGWSLLGGNVPWGPGAGKSEKSTGQKSRVKTATLEMELDHDTGQMTGQVLAGRFAGRSLGSLTLDEVITLWRDCLASDPQAAQLLEALLDRAEPRWREKAARAESDRASRSGGKMTVEEAYHVLGLEPGATRADIQRVHRELMKRFHPDQGGSNYLASKINEAKDVLLAHVT